MTDEDYQLALLQLMPRGKAWPQDKGSNLGMVLHALADAFARIDSQSEDIAERESMPRTALALLTDWETCLGLPECTDLGDTIEKRQSIAQSKFTLAPSLNINFYQELAKAYGYDIQIEQRFSHNCMRNCMYRIFPKTEKFTAYVNVFNQVDSYPATCLDDCMTPLIVYEAGDLACLLERYGPAHEKFVYFYPGE